MFLKFLLMGFLLLTACGSPQIKDYSENKPKLNLQNFFQGKLDAHGIVQGRSGKLLSSFTVDMKASWDGNQGLLDEDFIYSNGTTSKRLWKLNVLDNGKILAHAEDVNGDAKGEVAGNAFILKYSLALPIDGKLYNVNMTDWMFLVDQNTMLARTKITKWGFHVGDVTLVMRKL